VFLEKTSSGQALRVRFYGAFDAVFLVCVPHKPETGDEIGSVRKSQKWRLFGNYSWLRS
jgi:hypothetical protein